MPESECRSVALTITVSISGMASEMCVTSEALTITVSVYGMGCKMCHQLFAVSFVPPVFNQWSIDINCFSLWDGLWNVSPVICCQLCVTSEALTLTVSVCGMGCEMCHQLFAVSHLSPVLHLSHSLADSGPCLAVSTLSLSVLSVDC